MVPRVAFFPSEAGLFSVATLQTAVFAWALSRSLDGDLVNDYVDKNLIDALNWLGVDWDEGSGIVDSISSVDEATLAKAYITTPQQLLDLHAATKIDHNIYLAPGSDLQFTDILGRPHQVSLEEAEPWLWLRLGNRGSAITTAVVDIHYREITHVVIPYDERISIAIYQYMFEQLGWESPSWLCLPQLVNEQKQPLRHFPVHKFENDGYLPTAVFHYLLQLGWPPASQQPTLSKWEIREQFDVATVAAEPTPFNEEDLRQLNRHYVERLSDRQLAQEIRPFLEDAYGYLPATEAWLEDLTAVIRPQLATFEDAIEAAEWVFEDEVWHDEAALAALQTAPTRPVLTRLIAEFAQVVLLDEKTAVGILKSLYQAYPTWSKEDVAAPIFAALIGTAKEPPIPKILGIIGKQRALTRLGHALRMSKSE